MPINPVERIEDERLDELAIARRSVSGATVRELRRSLSNPYARSDRLAELNQTDLAELLGISTRTSVSLWENGKKPIGEDSLVAIHRISGVLTALPEFGPMEKYLFLVHPKEGFLVGVSVPAIELLRMPTNLGYQAVLHSINTNKPTPEAYRVLAPSWRIMSAKSQR